VAQREAILKETRRTKETILELSQRQDAAMATYTKEQESKLRARPLISESAAQGLRAAIADLRARRVLVQSQFASSFSAFLKDCRGTRQILQRKVQECLERKTMEMPATLQARIVQLQQEIAIKCLQTAQRPPVLHIGVSPVVELMP
jgi:hypothetical protein